MTPQEFIKKWQGCTLAERSFYQQHFNDLCALVDHPTPAEHDITGNTFCFEKGAKKTGGSNGWADVWKRRHFAMEYKGPGGDLCGALEQVQRYSLALENPPLLVVARADLIEIHTNFTNTVSDIHTISLEDIGTPANMEKLRCMFFDPERLRPNQTTRALTEQAAKLFASLADTLRQRGNDPASVAHFLDKLLFSFFAEDARLLPEGLVTRVLENGAKDTARIDRQLKQLFASMCKGGDFGADIIEWFNGGLFDSDATLPLTSGDIASLITVATLDWKEIEPSIFGTLFERGLDPSKRSQLGAHYTDPESIMRIITPVIIDPLNEEWEIAKAKIKKGVTAFALGGKGSKKGIEEAHAAYQGFMQRLSDFRVLDPACGSGNFLYLALHALKDIEHRAVLEAEELGLPMGFAGFHTGPHNVLGIELNSYAAELARVTVWIGELQWMLRHGMSPSRNPILKPLDHISCRDAVLNEDGSEAQWPESSCIIGNPPFLGDKKMRAELGDEYTDLLRKCYLGRVPGGADLVTYWFEKARAQIDAGKCQRAGLVATNSIRQKRNRPVLECIIESGQIFNAWGDEKWINEGAAVRVSLVCFGNKKHSHPTMLDGHPVSAIHADLTAGGGGGSDLTGATPLKENIGESYFGLCLAGPFKVPTETALGWLKRPNPNGRPNSDVLKPIYNGSDITRRWAGDWVIDFALMDQQQAALYEAPFAYVMEHVKPVRENNREVVRAEKWWRHGRPRPELRSKLAGLQRYIATPETAKHRFFISLPISITPEHSLIVIPSECGAILGILSSRIHTVWALAKGGRMGIGNDPRYNSTLTFDTFPFPEGLTPNRAVVDYSNPSVADITVAAQNLNQLRQNWLNPLEWVDWVTTTEEEKAGYPARPFPKLGCDIELKKRTLTNLYNERPTWLDQAHTRLDAAVASAYGWTDYIQEMAEDEILRRLLTLNKERTGQLI